MFGLSQPDATSRVVIPRHGVLEFEAECMASRVSYKFWTKTSNGLLYLTTTVSMTSKRKK